MNTVKKGQHLMSTFGEYGNYGMNGLMVAKVDFDLDEVSGQWISHRQDTKVALVSWLVDKGLVECLSCVEVNETEDETAFTYNLLPKFE